MTIRGKLRNTNQTILHGDGATGGVVVDDDSAHYVAVNIGNGVALNVFYFFKGRRESEDLWETGPTSYIPNVLPNHSQQVLLALLVNFHGPEHEIKFLFQSLGGRWYESTVYIKNKVIVDFGLKQFPESFRVKNYKP